MNRLKHFLDLAWLPSLALRLVLTEKTRGAVMNALTRIALIIVTVVLATVVGVSGASITSGDIAGPGGCCPQILP